MDLKVNRDWRVTVPKSVCDQAGIHPGDRLDITVRADGALIVRRIDEPSQGAVKQQRSPRKTGH
jgi:AbrB family looped-hinge helix DNA binding protein